MKHNVIWSVVASLLAMVWSVSSVSAQIGIQTIRPNLDTAIFASGLPSSESYPDIRSQNWLTDPADPVHPCRVGGASGGAYSVFFRVVHPGGSLNADTAGSNYNTVVSVFTSINHRPVGAAVACNDDAAGAATSAISTPLAGGEYIIMVSRRETTATAPGDTLALTMNLSFSHPNPPDNDSHTAPIPLTVGVTTVQPRPHLLTNNTTDTNIMASCQMFNTAWYSFSPPEDGFYRFDTYGTNIMWEQNYTRPASNVAIHNSAMTSIITCAMDNFGNAATGPQQMYEGTTYLIRVGSSFNSNMLPGTTYNIRPIFLGGTLTFNGSIDDNGAGWQTAGWDADDYFSAFSATMNADTTLKSITQVRINPPGYFKLSPKGTVFLRGTYSLTEGATATASLRLRIQYNDGTPQTVVNVPIMQGLPQSVSIPVKLASANVRRVRVQAILRPGSGQLSVDALYAEYYRGGLVTIRSAPADLLTLPDAPGQ